MKDKKSLQKFTQKSNKIEQLFTMKKVSIADIETLTRAEKDKFEDLLYERISSSTGIERDTITIQFSDILEKSTKNQLWESNHANITGIISNLLNQNNRMPTINEIAVNANLSRQTVNKHMKEFKSNPLYIEHLEQYQILIPALIGRVYKTACNGDMGAAKLFFNVMGCLNNQHETKAASNNINNNFIQINGLTINQDFIQNLDSKKLNQLQKILIG